MSAHTPGPWRAVRNGSFWQFNGADGFQIGDVAASLCLRNRGNGPVEAEDWATSEANARLIAAAPELLEALRDAALQLESVATKFGEPGSGNTIIIKARVAIAKATGDAA